MAKKAAVKATRELAVIDQVVVSEDEKFLAEAAIGIRGFFAGMAVFFKRTQELEKRALETLTMAKALKLPTSGEEDLQLQALCRNITADRKEVTEHWKITAAVSAFHKRLTGRRSKAEDPLEESSRIANALHNKYVEQERLRVAEAQAKIRREAEAAEQKKRDEELLRLEQEAIKREESSPDLSDREDLFIAAYLQDGNAQRAAQRAGYKDPLATAGRLLSSAKIQKAIALRREAVALRQQAAIRKEEPIRVDVPTVSADVTTKGNRTTHSAEVVDEQALIAAVIAGKHGIPSDILTIKPAKLNEYARSIEGRIELWPGVRYIRDTRVI